jgi:hypothetical protein
MKNKNRYSKTLLINWWNTNTKSPKEKWDLVCEYAIRRDKEFFQQLFDLRTCIDPEGWVAQKQSHILTEIGFIN